MPAASTESEGIPVLTRHRTRGVANPVARRARGFTLVELLVVIVVIGILAAIAIPVFLSQADKASDTALKSDLANAAKLLQVAEANGETLPSQITAGQVVDLGTAGTFTSSQTLTVTGSGETLCVEGVSHSGDTFSADLSEGVRNYDCDGNANGIAPLVLSYPDGTFSALSDGESLSAVVSGGDGAKTFAVSGDLPSGVTFDASSGAFTGPDSGEWGVTDFDAGGGHACAVRADGFVECWGGNNEGQTDVPANLAPGGGDTATQVTASRWWHTCALLTSGSIECWGYNSHGQTNVPANLAPGGPDTATEVIAGGLHTCALLTGGGMQCWGRNSEGQSTPPVDLQTGGVAQVTAGYVHTCVLTTSGGVECWGANGYGQTDVPASLQVSGVASVSAGFSFTCALTDAGGIQCWGDNEWGQTDVPASVQAADIAKIEPGVYNACVLTTSGGVQCWGMFWSGHGNVPESLQTSGASDLRVARYHSCVTVESTGAVQCWGRDTDGQATPPSHLASPAGPFPATVDVTVTDSTGSATTSVTLDAA